jgi:hypothetical protein
LPWRLYSGSRKMEYNRNNNNNNNNEAAGATVVLEQAREE